MKEIAGMILMVLTSHGQIDADTPTGVWLEEFAVPYEVFVEAGYEVIIASVRGGDVPVDPRSVEPGNAPPNAEKALALLKGIRPLHSVHLDSCVAVFFPGGHGTMFDLPGNADVQKALASFLSAGKPTALVCHGPAALVGLNGPEGQPVVKGRKLTAFTNDEEAAVGLTEEMPFLLQTRLEGEGAEFVAAENFAPNVVVDGNLITGQNPASSAGAARALLQRLAERTGASDADQPAPVPEPAAAE